MSFINDALGSTSVIKDFHWFFTAVLVSKVAMLKCPGNLKFKIFQALTVLPDPIHCQTHVCYYFPHKNHDIFAEINDSD